MTRVIVCGTRSFSDKTLLFAKLDAALAEKFPNVEIISGHAKGADIIAEDYAIKRNLALKIMPADWNKYGKSAGPIRNAEMLKYAMEEEAMVIAFWDGISRGTKNMISAAQKAGTVVHIVDVHQENSHLS